MLAGIVGNVMEWYDFAVYGYFAVVIGKLFFPSEDPAISLIASFGAFAAGFLVRPIGGLVFGRIGDLFGRKRALLLSVLAMAVPTVLIGLLPTHASIGIAAPVAVVALRLVQGLSVGGEYTSSMIYLAEHAPPERRALFASSAMWGCGVGVLLGSGVGALVTNVVDVAVVEAWAWRVPFLVGGIVAAAGTMLRKRMHVVETSGNSKRPIRDSFGRHRGAMIRVALLNVGQGVGFYAAFVYAVTYINEIDGLPEEIAFDLNTASMALLLVFLPLAAILCDRIGRKPLLIAGCGILAFGALPLFELMHSTDAWKVFCGEVGFAVAVSVTGAGLVAANVELMPRAVRCTGLAFAYNTALALFGGTTPLIASWLILRTGDPIAPAYYVAAAGFVSLITAVIFTPETRFTELD